jgi:hypothetical protein
MAFFIIIYAICHVTFVITIDTNNAFYNYNEKYIVK